MAKQSFTEKLLSSAVHQIGRDLGKTISNKAFGDDHATPVRHVYSNTNNQDTPTESKTSGGNTKSVASIVIGVVIIIVLALVEALV